MILFFLLISILWTQVRTEEVYFEEVTERDIKQNVEIPPADKLVLNLKRERGDAIQLQLVENRAINVNAPVYDAVYINGEHSAVLREKDQTIEGVKHYYDKDKNAALQIRCEPTTGGSCIREIVGVVDIDGETYDVKPKPVTRSRRSHDLKQMSHLLQRSDVNNMDFDDIKLNKDLKRNEKIIEMKKRTHNTYTVETIIAIDPPLWKHLVKRAQYKYGTTEDTVVEREARRYYSTLIHLVSMAYEGINHPDFTIKIVTSGFMFFKEENRKIRKSKVYTKDGKHTKVHFGKFLSRMYMKMRRRGNLPNADHVFTFTASSAQGVAGANCLGCICATWGWGWIVSTADDLSKEARLTTHEFGHGLGLTHVKVDKYPDLRCNPDVGYVMGKDVKGRFWEFSKCSIRELQTYFETKGKCLRGEAEVYNTEEWNAYTSKLPGEIRNITEQCVDVNNGKLIMDKEKESILCNDVTDPDFCYAMSCAGDNTCHRLAAADGTTCDLPSYNKWCIAGECVSRTGKQVTPQTTGDAENCYKQFPETYLGTKSKTKSGYGCQRWDKDSPHVHTWNANEKFLDTSVADAANHCRDPTAKGSPWCYLNVSWQYCNVPKCSPEKERKCADENWQYQKNLIQTRAGIPCQRWDSLSPHSHYFTKATYFPDATVADAGNFCRNPDNKPYAWCFTTDVGKRWDFCDVKKCKDESCYSRNVDYTGGIKSTTGGIPCQNWDSNTPHYNTYRGKAEGSACRSFDKEVPWCYLGKIWEYCDIRKCR